MRSKPNFLFSPLKQRAQITKEKFRDETMVKGIFLDDSFANSKRFMLARRNFSFRVVIVWTRKVYCLVRTARRRRRRANSETRMTTWNYWRLFDCLSRNLIIRALFCCLEEGKFLAAHDSTSARQLKTPTRNAVMRIKYANYSCLPGKYIRKGEIVLNVSWVDKKNLLIQIQSIAMAILSSKAFASEKR